MADPVRECFCNVCGLIAPSWFHSDFILYPGIGFTCIWCAFPNGHSDGTPHERSKPSGPYLTLK